MDNSEICATGKVSYSLFPSTRLTMALVGFLGSIALLTLRIDLSVAIVCMVNNTGKDTGVNISDKQTLDGSKCYQGLRLDESASSINNAIGEFDWSKTIQGAVLGAFFWGYMCTQILGGWLSHRIGPKVVLLCTAFVGAVLTLLTPLAARVHFGGLVLVRIILGLAQGVTYPALHTFWARWALPVERSILIGITNSGAQIGSMLALPIGGFLCEHGFAGGWPSIFYIFGTFAFLWVVLWGAYASNSPKQHRWINLRERISISDSLCSQQYQEKVPWKSIATSMPVWAAIVGLFAGGWGDYTVFTCLPLFMSEVLQFRTTALGFFASVPYIANFVCNIVSAFLADFFRRRRYLSTKNVRKLAMLTALWLQAGFFLGAGSCKCGEETLAMALLTLGTGLSGFQHSGACVNFMDIAPGYSGVLLGIGNTISSVGGIVVPYMMGLLTPNKSRAEWQSLFWLAACILVTGGIVFVCFADGEEQLWAKPKQTRVELEKDKQDRKLKKRLIPHQS